MEKGEEEGRGQLLKGDHVERVDAIDAVPARDVGQPIAGVDKVDVTILVAVVDDIAKRERATIGDKRQLTDLHHVT